MSLTCFAFVLFAAVEWMVHKLSWQVLVRSKPEVANGREPHWRLSFLIGRLHSYIHTTLWRTLSQQNESLNTKILYWSRSNSTTVTSLHYTKSTYSVKQLFTFHYFIAMMEFCIINLQSSSSLITVYWEIFYMYLENQK